MRHAHTTWNGPPRRFQGHSDVGLSPTGREDARRAIAALGDFALVVTSPARRCLETLEPLPQRTSPHQCSLLWEIDTGDFTGRPMEEVEAERPDWWRTWQTTPTEERFPGGESVRDLQRRVGAVARGLLAITEPLSGRALVMTHGGPIRVLLLAHAHRPLDDFHKLAAPNLSETILSRDEVLAIAERLGVG